MCLFRGRVDITFFGVGGNAIEESQNYSHSDILVWGETSVFRGQLLIIVQYSLVVTKLLPDIQNQKFIRALAK